MPTLSHLPNSNPTLPEAPTEEDLHYMKRTFTSSLPTLGSEKQVGASHVQAPQTGFSDILAHHDAQLVLTRIVKDKSPQLPVSDVFERIDEVVLLVVPTLPSIKTKTSKPSTGCSEYGDHPTFLTASGLYRSSAWGFNDWLRTHVSKTGMDMIRLPLTNKLKSTQRQGHPIGTAVDTF